MQQIKTDTETGIMYRKWESTSPQAVFLLVHGLGAQSERWEFLSQFLLRNNFSAYAIELRGYGETKGLRGHVDSFNIYYKDMESLYKIIKKELPAQKVFIMGESMGALIAFLLTLKNPGFFDGLVCVSPAIANKMHFPLLAYLKFAVSLIFNSKTLIRLPFNSQWFTRDSGEQKKLDADDREIRVASSKTLFNIILAQVKCNILKNKIDIPLLFLVAGMDKLVDAESSRDFFEKINITDKNIICYPEMYHALTIDSGRDTVFQDIVDWTVKHL